MIFLPAPAPRPVVAKPIAVARVDPPDVKAAIRHDAAEPLGRDSLEDQRPVATPGPKAEVSPPARETLDPPALPQPRVTLPEEVVLQLLESGKPLFVRCMKKAIAKDPAASSLKARVHVELDETAKVTATKADTDDAELAGCLERAARWLTYPATGKLVALELPLFYRLE